MEPRKSNNRQSLFNFVVLALLFALDSCVNIADSDAHWLSHVQASNGMWTAAGDHIEAEDALRVTALASVAMIGGITAR